MPTPIERIRAVCAAEGIPISKLEKDLGFGNGYFNPKKTKEIPSDRLVAVAEYIGKPTEYLLGITIEAQIDDTVREISELKKRLETANEEERMEAEVAIEVLSESLIDLRLLQSVSEGKETPAPIVEGGDEWVNRLSGLAPQDLELVARVVECFRENPEGTRAALSLALQAVQSAS